MERLTMYEVIEHCKRKVQKIEAMFRKEHLESDNCGVADLIQNEYWEHRQVAEWLEQLKAYKDAEEQGLLLRLPCPIGTTVYAVVKECEGDACECYHTCDTCDWNNTHIEEINLDIEYIDGVFEWIFLTREEAEEKLAEMQKG